MAGLTALPSEILQHIFTYLPPSGLSAVSQTCHLLQDLSRLDSFWRAFCRDPALESPAPFESWYDLYSKRWHKWSWFAGLWCNGRQWYGALAIGRYSPASGNFELHVRPRTSSDDRIFAPRSL